jgi:hypothetical protein
MSQHGEGITAQDLGDFIGAGVLPYTVTGGRVKFFLGTYPEKSVLQCYYSAQSLLC